MKCRQFQHWLSDIVNRDIPEKKKTLLEDHIQTCSACRNFRDQIELIQKEAQLLERPETASVQDRDFATRLKSAIAEAGEGQSRGILQVFRNKWIFAPASLVLISLFILIFVFYEQKEILDDEFYVFSFGGAVEEIYKEIGDNTALHQEFNQLIAASINRMLFTPDWEETLGWEDNLSLWEEMSGEEPEENQSRAKKGRNS